MRSILGWLCATAAMAVMGCSGSSGDPLAPAADPQLPHGTQAALGEALSAGSSTLMPLGLYTFQVDLNSMSASVAPRQVRTAAEAGGDIYALCVSDFFPSPPIKITEVEISGTSLSLGYDVTHPFAAPTNTAGPASASNRADLGIQGQCVFLCDATLGGIPAASSFYAGDTVMNADIVSNAHGYTEPGDLLDLTGFTCNTFPYRVLVDELDASCRSVTATGAAITSASDTGNYVTDGWQLGNIGASNANWHGYGVLHQGQTASSSVDLDLDGIEDYVSTEGSFSLEMALLATYNDPRGGTTAAEKKGNRLPSSPADADAFLYDMPRAACPMERVAFPDQTWDLLNPVPATASVSAVSWSSSAPCTVTMSCVDMFGPDPITFVSTPTGDGTPSDPLAWTETIGSYVLLACPAGEYEVCVTVTNTTPEASTALDCALGLVAGGATGHSKKEFKGHVTLLK